MTEKYYRDDFRVEVEFDRPIGTDVDFAGTLYTEETLATRRVRFGRRGGQEQGCEVSADGFKVTIPADGHQLSPGDGLLEMVYLVPAQELPDGSRKIVRRYRLDLRLTAHEPAAGCGCGEGCTCTPAVVTAKVEIPWQYVHDTDVYNEVLERVNGKFAAILGTEDVKPAPAPTPSAGVRAVSRPMLRRGMLNLRNQTGDVYKVRPVKDNERCIFVKVMLKYGEDLDLSQWVDTDSIIDVTIPHIAFFELNQSSLERDGSVVRLVGPKYKDSRGLEIDRLPIRILLDRGSAPSTGFIKMKNGRIVDVPVDEACDPGIYLPKVTKAEAIAYFKRRDKETRTDGKTIINGRLVEVQRRVRGTKHHYDAELKRSIKTSNRKWRRWIKQGTSKAHIVRMRYKSCKGYTGAWSYFSHLLVCSQNTHLVSEL